MAAGDYRGSGIATLPAVGPGELSTTTISITGVLTSDIILLHNYTSTEVGKNKFVEFVGTRSTTNTLNITSKNKGPFGAQIVHYHVSTTA
jgi:hypothetical protein